MIHFRKANFLIVGLARNCESSIKKDIFSIDQAFSLSGSRSWLIIESDSNDNTLKNLNTLKHEFNLRVISLGNLINEYPKRTERIAACRNKYVKEIRTNQLYKDIDYVVVVDLDGVNANLKKSCVEHCWNLNIAWDVCFANQSYLYYDIWALRHPFWSPNDCYEQEKFLIQTGLSEFKAKYLAVYSKMKKINIKNQPIKVQSAFGGLGIYKRNFFNLGRYEGIDKNGNEVCEHVTFHMNRPESHNLYIVPSLINCGINEHSRYAKPINLIFIYFITLFVSFNTLSKIRYFFKKLKLSS